MKCFHAHTPSHSPTPLHMAMPSVAIVTSNANDTQIPSLCRLTNTQCNLPMGNPSRVNPDSYHSTLGLSDEHDRVFSLGNRTFRITPQVSNTHTELSDSTAGLLHTYRIFRILLRVSFTHTGPFGYYRGSPSLKFQAFHLRGLTTPFLLRPTRIDYFSFSDLNFESSLDVVSKTNPTHTHQEWWMTIPCTHTRLDAMSLCT